MQFHIVRETQVSVIGAITFYMNSKRKVINWVKETLDKNTQCVRRIKTRARTNTHKIGRVAVRNESGLQAEVGGFSCNKL